MDYYQSPSTGNARQSSATLRYVVYAVLGWSALVAISAYWNFANLQDQVVHLAASEARTNWNKDQSFRRRASRHGRFYVRPNDRTPPSPYLSHLPNRDVETTNGIELTLMDPAYMMRQMTEEFEELYGTKGKLTGQVVLNPANEADPWELEALKKFDNGVKEVIERAEIDGEPYIRLMRPMVMKKSCEKCHGRLGYKEGDIRGGVSVSVPLAKYEMAVEKSGNAIVATHGGVWAMGALVIGFVGFWRDQREKERAKDKSALEESKDKYRALVQSQSELICRFMPDTTLTFVNAAYARFYGRDAVDLIGTRFSELLTPEEREKTAPYYLSFTPRNAIREREQKAVAADGSVHWHLWSIQAFFGDDGSLQSFQATGTDITARKLAEADVQRLAAEEAALGALLKLALQDISMETYLQRSIDNLLTGVPWLNLLPSGGLFLVERDGAKETLKLMASRDLAPDLLTKCARVPFGTCLCGRAALTRQIQYSACIDHRHEITYDGIIPHGHYNVPIMRDEEVLGVIVFYLPAEHPKDEHCMAFLARVADVLSMGITARQAAQALSETEERFRSISKSSTIAMIVAVDQDGNIVSWNPAAERAFGYSEAEILGRSLTDIMPDRYREAHEEGFRRAVETDDYRIIGRTVEVHAVRKGGDEFPIEMSLGTWKQEGRKYFSAVIHDITDRKRAEAQLMAAKEEAEHADRAKSEFLASMSHELRTPLNAVLGFAQLMQHDPQNPLPPVQMDHVENILDGGKHLLGLVDDILDLARIEADQLDLMVEEIDASELVLDCVALTTPLGTPKGIALDNQFANSPPVVIRTDRRRLKQVLLNLLSNAVKFNNVGGTVAIGGRITDDGFLRLSVADTGIGIANENQPWIFQMFHRAGAGAFTTHEGTGIGLTVSKHLVEKMAGRIGFESEEGIGSTFWIEIPLASNHRVLIWTEGMRIGIDAIDKDHQFLVSLVNRISHHSVGDADVDAVLGEILDYTSYHFRREETAMEVCGYPGLEEHREGHRQLTARATDMADTWRRQRNPQMLGEIQTFLKDWLFDHIMNADAELAKFAKSRNQEIRRALEHMA